MKKGIMRGICAICAAGMLAGGAAVLPASAAEVQTVRIMGDLDGDKRVTLDDAKMALDISVKSMINLAESAVTEETDAGDINMNGKIEIMDALAIMRYFCQTLVGDQPLWSDVRKVTYHDGTEYNPYYVTPENRPENYVNPPFEKRGLYVEIGCAEGKPGETVSVPVYLAGAEKLLSFSHFQTTPEGVKLTDVESDLGISYMAYIDENGVPQGKELCEPTIDNANVVNLENGAFIWTAPRAEDITLTDGLVIATYKYQIPETAKAGDTYVITLNPEKTTYSFSDSSYSGKYQYTLLDGVIAVK